MARLIGKPSGWWRQIAPEPPRSVRGERALGIALRTAHLLAFGILLGGSVWGVGAGRLRPALAAAVISGGAMAGLELYKSLHWLFLGKGLFVLAKLALLAWLPFAGGAAPAVLAGVAILGSVGAHLPSRYRHYSVLLGRPVEGGPKAVTGGPRPSPTR